MARVAALYRYPVKGFTPEPLESLRVQPDGRASGDRVLAFRFADAAQPEARDGLDYWPKAKGLSLQDFPSLAALRLVFDDARQRVRVYFDGSELVSASLDAAGRRALIDAVTNYLLGTADGKRLARPGRLPLQLVGDGVQSRFQDRPQGYLSLHSRASVSALSEAMGGDTVGDPLDGRRFRSNIIIDGVEAWEELHWQGGVRIGTVHFETAGPIVRCLATHANPDTGTRDARVLTGLTQQIGQQEPTLGRLLLHPAAVGGEIRIGDEVVAGDI